MNANHELEQQLESLGNALRERPRLTDRVMEQVRQLPALVAEGPSPRHEPSALPSKGHVGRRWQLIGATSVAAVAMLLVAFFSPSRSAGWEDVVKAIRDRPWMRARTTHLNGKTGTMWLSTQRQIWAFRSDEFFQFSDGAQRAKYEYRVGAKQITKFPLGENDLQRVMPLNDLAQDKQVLGPWLFGSEKIVSQQRREIVEDGKRWIEFDLVLWRGDSNQTTLRVDPQTKLPVFLSLKAPNDAKKTIQWEFDYPEDGPQNVYALGVPAEITIDDRMLPNEGLKAIDGIAASRARIGDFRLIVAEEGQFFLHVVQRKGSRWRIDYCMPQRFVGNFDKPAQDQTWLDFYEQRLKTYEQIPLYVCDGQTVFENPVPRPKTPAINWQRSSRTGPQDLLAGEGLGSLPRAAHVAFASQLFPDLSPRSHFQYEFDPTPAGLPDCVLFKRSTEVTWPKGATAHEWYYLDKTKGFALARAELFSLFPNQKVQPESTKLRQTIVMKEFQKAPQGWWFAAEVESTLPTMAGPQPANPVAPKDSIQPPVDSDENVKRSKHTIRYLFDFNATLPDNLFEIPDAANLRK